MGLTLERALWQTGKHERGKMNRKEAIALVEKHGSQRAAAAAAGIARSTFGDIINGRYKQSGAKAGVVAKAAGKTAGKQEAAQTKGGRSLAEFKQVYDKDFIIPNKIKAGLKTLGSGWDYEREFARLCGISLNDMAAYRDEFAEYMVVIKDGRRAWAGSKSAAEQMRSML
jgi:hypothetical protein